MIQISSKFDIKICILTKKLYQNCKKGILFSNWKPSQIIENDYAAKGLTKAFSFYILVGKWINLIN